MTTKTPLRLWWKVRGTSHLHPVRKLVYRLGHHGEAQIYQQTYWVADEQQGQPQPLTPENLDEILDGAKVRQWYDDLREAYEDEVGRVIGWADPVLGLKEDDWVEVVNDAHKNLKETYGSDRIVVLIPTSTPSLRIPVSQDLVGLPYFGLLQQYSDAEVTRHILDKAGLPYVYWHAISCTLSATPLNTELDQFFQSEPEARTTLLMEPMETTTSVRTALIPDTVIDPNSKKEILTDDYLKRLLPSLESALSDAVWTQMRRLGADLQRDAQFIARRESVGFLTYPFRHPEAEVSPTRLSLSPSRWDSILDWIRVHPEPLKALFSFIMPTGDRDVALLGLYAGIKTMQDFVELCTSPEWETLKASDFMERVQESFERRVEESKRIFGMEKFPIPARRVWETLWLALDCLLAISHSAEEGTANTLGRVLKSENWSPNLWNEHSSQILKHIVGVLFGHEAVEKFYDEPFRSGELGRMLDTLRFWGYTLKKLGLRALGENPARLMTTAHTLNPLKLSEGSDHIQVAQKTIRKVHGAVSSIIRAVQKVKGGIVGEQGATDYLAAVIDYSPLGFYSLTQDGTCFGDSNSHHPFILSALKGSFVLRVFAPRMGYLGRMWGVLHPDDKTAYLTNRYGRLNITQFRELARQVFATLFQVPPDNLSVEGGEGVNSEISSVLTTSLSEANREISRRGYWRGYSELPFEIPYLNQDAFKVQVKG